MELSIFFPYSPNLVIDYLSELFSFDYTSLSAFESTIITIFSNLYFFVVWFIIVYFSLKIFNRIWERLF